MTPNSPTASPRSHRRSGRPRTLVAVAALITVALTLSAVAPRHVQAGDNLPVFTSAIEITRGNLQIRATVPDRDSGRPLEATLPIELLGYNDPMKYAKLYKLTHTPLGAQLDEYWNVTPDPKTDRTPRQDACDGEKGLNRRVQEEVSKTQGRSAYNIVCNLAPSGIVVTQDVGSTRYISYQLLNNTIQFYVANGMPTCPPGSDFIICPNDPSFTVRFAIDLWTVVRTPDLCHVTASNGTVNVKAVKIEAHNAAAELAQFYEREFGDDGFRKGEDSIRATVQQVPLPLDGALKEIRDSKPCTDRNDIAAPVAAAFREVETSIERGDLIFRLIHPPIAAPRFQTVSLPYGPNTCESGYVWREAFDGDTVCVTPERRGEVLEDNAQAAARREPNGGAFGPNTCKSGFVWRVARPEDLVCVTPEERGQIAAENAQASAHKVLGATTPSFARPSIAVPPIANAGGTVEVTGTLFPPNVNVATVLRLALERDATAACTGGATELEWGPAGGQMRVIKLPVDTGGYGSCAYRYEATGLNPATAYQFRARDCDALTCSPWSAALRLTTEATGMDKGKVVLSLDSASRVGDTGTVLGTATVGTDGTFKANVIIPAGTSAGMHTIYAVSGDITAQTGFQVSAGGAGGSKATIVLTGSFFGDVGCPMRPLPNPLAEIEGPFPIFGAGFAPGTVTIHLDTATGLSLGTATVKPDGTFCQDFTGPPASGLGDHTLVAVQNGMVVVTSPVKFIRPDVLH